MNQTTTTIAPLAHADSCQTIFVQSAFDRQCPRCTILYKVVMLRRKRMSQGCSLSEQMSAESIAQALIAKHGLKHAECVDRAYEKALAAAKAPEPVQRKKRGASTAWQRTARATKNDWVHYEVDESEIA